MIKVSIITDSADSFMNKYDVGKIEIGKGSSNFTMRVKAPNGSKTYKMKSDDSGNLIIFGVDVENIEVISTNSSVKINGATEY